MKNDEQRILLSKLRISNHNLEIKRGRHRGLQAKERICKLCLKEVEFLCRTNCSACADYQPWIYNYYY
jgi:hypothetical protein